MRGFALKPASWMLEIPTNATQMGKNFSAGEVQAKGQIEPVSEGSEVVETPVKLRVGFAPQFGVGR